MNGEIYIIIVLLAMIFLLISNIDSLKKKIDIIDSKLNKIAKQVGVPEEPINDEIRQLVMEGKKIQAIKKLRDATGLGLKDAKDYVDNLYK